MAIGSRLWRVGRWLLLVGALVATFFVFAAVGMRVALRAREVRVPPLTNRTVTDANRTLTDLGLTLRVDDTVRVDPRVPAGHIVQQDPAPGQVARRHRTVRVWVSSGPRVTTVPRLVGETERTAQLRLDQQDLTLGTVSQVELTGIGDSFVVGQEPAPGEVGARVSLLVNRQGGAHYLMPDLIGANADRAADVLRSAGFRVTVTGQQAYPGVMSGIVLRQQPLAGYEVSATDPIALEVSR